VDDAVGRAASGPRLSWWAGVWHRLINRPVTLSVGLDYHGGQRGVAALVRRIAAAVNVAPQDASIGLVDGQVQRRHARNGRALDVHRASAALSAAVRGTATAVTLPMKPLAPRVRDSGLSKTIAVDVGRNRLTLYDGLKVEKTYPVATAKPGFYTPRGT
jgi:lipoprotein-anchoring transpeptidase ErfK/SrfK